jgi:hypothetical protein
VDVQHLTELVTAEVKRVLAERGPAGLPRAKPEGAPRPTGPLVAVVFTGGTFGLDDALVQLAQLRAEGVQLRALLTPAAERAVGRDRVLSALGAGSIIEAEDSAGLCDLNQHCAAAVIATLTRNSAVKLALGITETAAMGLVYQVLMRGKPVIAARNSADPDSGCAHIGLPGGPPALLDLLRGYLDRLASFGIELVDASELAAATRHALARTPGVRRGAARAVITEADVAEAASAGREIIVEGRAIVTPLARDAAEALGVRIIESGS